MKNLAHLGIKVTKGPADTMELSLKRHGPRIRKQGKIINLTELKRDMLMLYTLNHQTPPPQARQWLYSR